jgi:hypothetical protein
MSEKTENTEIESEAPEAIAAPVEETKPASQEIANETNSEATSDNNKAVFGTRKSKPGAASGSNVKPLSQIRGVFDDDDEIEMDDLPVRATAPAHLVANERPRQNRERDENRDGENRRGPRRERSDERPRAPRTERPKVERENKTPTAETTPAPVLTNQDTEVKNDEDRPERFGSVSEETLESRKSVQEFSPSKDGRRAPEKKSEAPTRRPARQAPAKKGLFAWLKSLFVAEPKVEKKPYENRRPSQGKDGNRRRRPNNGPRRDGNRPRGDNPNRPRGERNENGENGENRRPEGQNRRRRQGGQNRRPRQDGQERKQPPSE